MFEAAGQSGGVPSRDVPRLINLSDIRQLREECQHCSPLTSSVKAEQWSSDPPILLLPTSGQPCSNGDFMDGVSLYRDLTGQLWEPDVLQNESIT